MREGRGFRASARLPSSGHPLTLLQSVNTCYHDHWRYCQPHQRGYGENVAGV
jgi:hypothetical protein